MRDKIHRINVRWPWLKVVLAILMISAVTGGILGVLQREVRRATEEIEMSEEAGRAELDAEEVDSEKQEVAKSEIEEAGEVEAEVAETDVEPEVAQSATSTYVIPQNTGRKVVALTFDDGPSAATTPRLLDILAAKQVKVTFFVLGNMAQKSPDLIRREAAEGHEVESHTMSHQNLTKLSGAAIQGEVGGVDDVLRGITGSAAKLVRPPYGSINDVVRSNVGKPMIIWTVDPEDWKYRDGPTVRERVVSKTFDGAIVLMHDIHSTTIDAVAGIIDDLRAAGYEFLTVSEMAAERGVVLQDGYSYGSFRP